MAGWGTVALVFWCALLAAPSSASTSPSTTVGPTVSSGKVDLPQRRIAQATTAVLPSPSPGKREENEDDDVIKSWKMFESTFKRIIDKVSKMALPSFTRMVVEADIDPKCSASLARLAVDLRKLKIWAFRMFDATGKPGSGLLTGSMSMLGNIRQCLAIQGPLKIRGRYCLVENHLPLPPKPWFYYTSVPLPVFQNFTSKTNVIRNSGRLAHYLYFLKYKIGLCIPSACSANDIDRLTRVVMNSTGLQSHVSTCRDTLRDDVDMTQATILALYGVAIFFVLAGTAVDILFPQKEDSKGESLALQVFRCFSAVRNGKKVLSTHTSPDSLPSLHGLKVLTICWVTLGHTYVTVNYETLSNMNDFLEYGTDLAFQTVLNATVSVDTFFVISGLLVSMVVIRLTRRLNASLNIPIFIARRIWRLWPPLFAAVGFVFLMPLTGYGPLFHETLDPIVNRCRKNWWATLLFFNNWQEDQCLDPGWFVAADLQLYILSLVVLVPLIKKPRLGLAINGGVILFGISATAMVTWLSELPPTMLFVNPDPEQRRLFWSKMYFTATPHIAPYFIGLALGYLLVDRPQIQLSRSSVVAGWTASTALAVGSLWGVYPWNASLWVPSQAEAVLYAAIHRPAWGLAVAWIILACRYGAAGPVARLLSWKAFGPLARLVYCVFLMHYSILFCVTSQIGYVEGSHTLALWVAMGTVLMSFVLALPASLVFESPYVALEGLFLDRLRASRAPEKTSYRL